MIKINAFNLIQIGMHTCYLSLWFAVRVNCSKSYFTTMEPDSSPLIPESGEESGSTKLADF